MLFLNFILIITITITIATYEKYTAKYDNINIDEVLTSERLLQSYVNCLVNEGPCTSDGLELKSMISIY